MSKQKFTPCPWKIVKEGHEGIIISIRDKHRNWICECNYALVGDESKYGHPIITEREALANARLIAAAPEMYDFLEKLVNQIEENGLMQYDVIHNGENWVLEWAKELLSKSRGESEAEA